MNTVKVKKIRGNYVGKSLPSNIGGGSGRAFERMLKSQGIGIDNGNRPDIKINKDTGVEVKTRDIDAVSPVTTGSMTVDTIINTPWEQSSVCKKLQQQMRVKTKNGVILPGANNVYDFSGWHIQSLFKEAYNICQAKLAAGDRSNTIAGNKWGYFEQCTHSANSYIFRHSDNAFKKIERLSRSTFNDLFEVVG
jgi:hypothetical protein